MVELDTGVSGTGKTEVVVGSLEMLSGRGKKDYAKEVQAAVAGPESESEAIPAAAANGHAGDAPQEALIAM